MSDRIVDDKIVFFSILIPVHTNLDTTYDKVAYNKEKCVLNLSYAIKRIL